MQLNLAAVAPDWLQTVHRAEWVERYGRRVEMYRLPKSQTGQMELAQQIGEDGFRLLEAAQAEDAPAVVKELWSREVLRRIWIQQYYGEGEQVHWRSEQEGLPPAHRMLASPDDLEARYGGKEGFFWTGYKAHLTETCGEGQPRLITDVATTFCSIYVRNDSLLSFASIPACEQG